MRVEDGAKITSISPSVAITPASRCAGLARWWVEMLTAVRANIAQLGERRGSGAGSVTPASLNIDGHHFNWYLYIDDC